MASAHTTEKSEWPLLIYVWKFSQRDSQTNQFLMYTIKSWLFFFLVEHSVSLYICHITQIEWALNDVHVDFQSLM